MRWIAALLTTAAASLLSGAAHADDGPQALFGAAFSQALLSQSIDLPAGPTLGVSAGPDARYQPGQGLVRWTSDEVATFSPRGVSYLDTVRVSTAALDPLPGAALLRPTAGETLTPAAYDVTYLRRWPSAFAVRNGRLNFDLSPHAGLGISTGGGRSAEAGALLRMAKMVGMAGRGAPRWYLYASYTKRLVGLNLMRGADEVRREGLQDEGMVRNVQAGFGAQRGRVHALLGYTRERVSMRSLGERVRDDNRLGLNLSIR